MRLPQWLIDDLELEPFVSWVEDGPDIIRYNVEVELFGRPTRATAKLGADDVIVLDRLAMMISGTRLDEASGDLVKIPEPYLRI